MPAYIGVNGKAKGIKYVYQGNNKGKAQLIYGERGLYRSSISVSPLSSERMCMASCGNEGSYTVFGGGITIDDSNNLVTSNALDAYEVSSFTKIIPSSSLSIPRCLLSSGYINSNYIFAGGSPSVTNMTASATVDAYNNELTKIDISELTIPRINPILGRLGYASTGPLLVAGGYTTSTTDSTKFNRTDSVEGYDKALTKINAPDLIGCNGLETSISQSYYNFHKEKSICYTRIDSYKPDRRVLIATNNRLHGFTINLYDNNLTETNIIQSTSGSMTYCDGVASCVIGDSILIVAGNDVDNLNGPVLAFDTFTTRLNVTSFYTINRVGQQAYDSHLTKISGGNFGDLAIAGNFKYQDMYAYDETLTLSTVADRMLHARYCGDAVQSYYNKMLLAGGATTLQITSKSDLSSDIEAFEYMYY